MLWAYTYTKALWIKASSPEQFLRAEMVNSDGDRIGENVALFFCLILLGISRPGFNTASSIALSL